MSSSSSQPIRKETEQGVSPGDFFYGQPNGILFDENQWAYIRRRYDMSPREVDVAKLVCCGLSNKEIADDLKIQQGTVKTHMRNIYRRIRVKNKVTMLLTFMNDVSEFFGNSNAGGAMSLVDRKRPNPKTFSL